MKRINFSDLRSDWYAANTVLPREFVRAILSGNELTLVGFPSLWIPVCVYYGVRCEFVSAPISHTPIFSQLSASQLTAIAQDAQTHGRSRALMEAAVALDPVLADFVYIVDHKLARSGYSRIIDEHRVFLNTWHSFGRPEVIALQKRMCGHVLHGDTFLMLPCSRSRPYGTSKTHRRLYEELARHGVNPDSERVVVTAVGVVPAAFWREPLVMSYDAGAVDLWRIFSLLRAFFSINRPKAIVDCLSFRPYSDMLGLLHDLGMIPKPTRPLRLRWRSFYVKSK